MQLKDSSLLRTQAYIDGAWIDAGDRRNHGAASGWERPLRSSPSRSVGEADRREAVVEGSGLALPFDVANPSVSPAGCHLPFAPREEDL